MFHIVDGVIFPVCLFSRVIFSDYFRFKNSIHRHETSDRPQMFVIFFCVFRGEEEEKSSEEKSREEKRVVENVEN